MAHVASVKQEKCSRCGVPTPAGCRYCRVHRTEYMRAWRTRQRRRMEIAKLSEQLRAEQPRKRRGRKHKPKVSRLVALGRAAAAIRDEKK